MMLANDLKSSMTILTGSDVRTVGGKGRGVASALVVDVEIIRIQTGIGVSGIISIRNARVSASKENTHALKTQLHPLMALADLIEFGQSSLS
jgi:orotate phosphoribosyltransferase